tara:strand:- start:1158 stop:1538 length:381 start_codon:yes stop_codon:yes gene_type:complete
MKNSLIIDAANKIFFLTIIKDNKYYTSTFLNSRENFDKFTLLISNFLRKNKLDFNDIKNLYINQGPGKFAGLKISISVAKAISLSKKINLYGFKSEHVENGNYLKILELGEKNLLNKGIINPIYKE